MTQQEIIAQIRRNAPLPIEKIIDIEIKEFRASKKFQTMVLAWQYYINNSDINKKQRYFIQKGQKQIDTNVENNKISHPFLRQLTDQKVQYLLSNDWSIDDAAAADIFNDIFRYKLQSAARDAILFGIGWLFFTVENNMPTFKRYPSNEIIPIWTDNEHTKLQSIIRIYNVTEYVSSKKEIVEYAEYWTLDGVFTYRKENSEYKLIGEAAHLASGNKMYNWERIPFIPIKYNDDEISLLVMVKSIIDEYNKTVSLTADLLSDQTNKVMVINGAQGTDVTELSQNIKLYRKMLLPEDGKVQEVGTDPDITASIAHQQQLRANIYEFGRGVDYNANIGANASGEARRYLYANLDLDCNQLESGVLDCLHNIIWFLNAIDNNIPDNVKIEFSRNMMINSTEIIDNAVKAQGITGVSMNTVVGLLPFVENPADEIAKWKEEQAQEFAEQHGIINQLDGINFEI